MKLFVESTLNNLYQAFLNNFIFFLGILLLPPLAGITAKFFISNDLHVIKDSLFEPPFLFRLIQSESNTDWKEMYKVFNCGHRMELFVDPKFADKIISISHSFDIEAKIIGRVEKSKSKKLSIKSEFGEFNY